MKVWKILNSKDYGIACYVKVNESVFDSSYKALQLAREKISKDLCTTQLLDVNEEMLDNIPILEYVEVI